MWYLPLFSQPFSFSCRRWIVYQFQSRILLNKSVFLLKPFPFSIISLISTVMLFTLLAQLGSLTYLLSPLAAHEQTYLWNKYFFVFVNSSLISIHTVSEKYRHFRVNLLIFLGLSHLSNFWAAMRDLMHIVHDIQIYGICWSRVTVWSCKTIGTRNETDSSTRTRKLVVRY